MSKTPPGISGRDIVMVGLQPWYFKTGCTAKNIAQMLAPANRVLYVNVPIKRSAFYSRKNDQLVQPHIDVLKQRRDNLKLIGPNLWEYYPETLIDSVNWLPTTQTFKLVNRLNNRRFARNIRKAMTTLGFKDIILFNDNDIYNGFGLKELLKPSMYIYYLRDWLQGFAYWKKHATVLEPELIRKADAVLANSPYFVEYSTAFNPHTYYMGQGCDFEHFNPANVSNIPEDLAALPRPIIGYIGAIDSQRLDPEIIALIARNHPSWSIAMVGPEDAEFQKSFLHQIPNIHFLGRKHFNLLSSYIAGFDVCINPQLQNEITRGNYPLKIDEYLAMGKPVVATRTPTMKIFEDHTYLADRPDDYEDLIKKALETTNSPGKRETRIAFAHTHSWENSMLAFYQAVHDFEQNIPSTKIA